MWRKFVLIVICLLALTQISFAKTESSSDDAASVVAYGQGPSGIVPIKVDADGYVDIGGSPTLDGLTVTGVGNRVTVDDVFVDGNDNSSAGVMRLGGTGNTNNESMDIDFESTADQVKLSTATATTFNNDFPIVAIGTKTAPGDAIQNVPLKVKTFSDSSFTDDEEFQISTDTGKGIGPNVVSPAYGTNGVDPMEDGTNYTTVYSDVSIRTGFNSGNLDDDGGTVGSPSGDNAAYSTAQKYAGAGSQHVVVDAGTEGLSLSPTTYASVDNWYRFKFAQYEVSGSLITSVMYVYGPKIIEASAGTGAWEFINRDFYWDSVINTAAGVSPLGIRFYSSGAAADFYIDSVSLEKVTPMTGFGYCQAGSESALFNVYSQDNVLEDAEDAWDEQVIANVTASADNTVFQEGLNSAKFDVASGFTTGLIGTEAITSTDMTSNNLLTFWVRSSVNLANGDYAVVLDNSANCASVTATMNLPAMTANTWYKFSWSPSGGAASNGLVNNSATISIGVKQNTDKGAMNFWIDGVHWIEHGKVALVSNTANTVATDTDNKFCIYDKPMSITPAVKNRLGSTKEMRCAIWYY